MDKRFNDKTVIVTGASFGIGSATAVRFAEEGARLVLVDCIEDTRTLDMVRDLGAEAISVKCDVSDEAQVQAMIKQAVDAFGQIDIAFNNAGIEGVPAPAADYTSESWNRTLAVNLTGAWLCMKYEIHEMLKQGKGAIVNTSSVAGLVGFQTSAAYVASKHGLIGLTKTAALDYVKQGLRINAVCPGVIRTPMIDRFTGKNKEVEKQFENMEPIGRMGEPLEVANAVLWLCSDEASFVTGHAMTVDGGWVAQ